MLGNTIYHAINKTTFNCVKTIDENITETLRKIKNKHSMHSYNIIIAKNSL